MAQILKFPSKYTYAPVRARNGQRHRVTITVVDRRRPKKTRWEAQWAVQRAASFRGLRGFTDLGARAHAPHTFVVFGVRLLTRFLRDVEQLVRDGRVAIEVDGLRVRVKGTTAA
jgi:hypothetical protein